MCLYFGSPITPLQNESCHGLKLWTAIKHFIYTRVRRLSSLTSICRWWKWWDVFYCSYLTAWLCADIDTSLAAAHRSSALIHVLLHTSAIFAGPCPRKMWLHSTATVWRTFCLWVSLSAFPAFFTNESSTGGVLNVLHNELDNANFHFFSSIFTLLLAILFILLTLSPSLPFFSTYLLFSP